MHALDGVLAPAMWGTRDDTIVVTVHYAVNNYVYNTKEYVHVSFYSDTKNKKNLRVLRKINEAGQVTYQKALVYTVVSQFRSNMAAYINDAQFFGGTEEQDFDTVKLAVETNII